jgi:glyoxylase-like metal-dependent hydrolase (beta-lactamase superfamily II)
MPGPGTWRALQDRLKQAGLATRHVHTVIVTHSHPDHFGGASRFAKESGARVVAHHAFRFGPAPPERETPEVSVDDLAAQQESDETADDEESNAAAEQPREPWRKGLTPWGGQRPRPPFRVRVRWAAMRLLGATSIVPTITHPVEHGDVLELAGREWFVVHTPGHTADHFCLHDPESNIFLAGDHVLPTITPHIAGVSTSPDPLASFFYSLDRVGEIAGVEQVLPAHGHPFDDLRERTQAIKRHHYDRLDKVKEIGRELGPATVEAFSQRLFKPRSWGAMAESETYAHLEHLRIAGEAARSSDRQGRYLYETG